LFSFFTVGLWGFDWLGQLMAAALRFLFSFTNSWGIAIILFTLLIRLLLHPLNKKQMDSMKGMQAIQPELQKLQKQYKSDPQTLNAKSMELYKERGVNPAAGCLPLLIQMPILIALFESIRGLAELKDASFLWLPSLTQTGDMVLVMATAAVTLAQTYIQQKLTPSAAGNQSIMLYMMPLMIIFIGRGLPAGVLLYWFTSTSVMAIQQFFIYKDKEPVAKGGAS
jgi:YidC/Oxa1 family membrane protein insertase